MCCGRNPSHWVPSKTLNTQTTLSEPLHIVHNFIVTTFPSGSFPVVPHSTRVQRFLRFAFVRLRLVLGAHALMAAAGVSEARNLATVNTGFFKICSQSEPSPAPLETSASATKLFPLYSIRSRFPSLTSSLFLLLKAPDSLFFLFHFLPPPKPQIWISVKLQSLANTIRERGICDIMGCFHPKHILNAQRLQGGYGTWSTAQTQTPMRRRLTKKKAKKMRRKKEKKSNQPISQMSDVQNEF